MSLNAHDHLWDACKASPVVCWGLAKLGGYSVADWASLAALIYTLILISEKLWKFWKGWKRKGAA